MKVINDQVYPENEMPTINVVSVKPLDGHRLWLRFSSGETKIFDASPLLDIDVYSDLKNEALFKQVDLSFGTLAWKNGLIDIAPETLYHQSDFVG